MIIDMICDRFQGFKKYNEFDFYCGLEEYAEIWPELAYPIMDAMDNGNEQDVVNALRKYLTENGYGGKIYDYVSSVRWLEDD